MALPRKRPVPMAPPMAIMESWRGVKLRCSPSSRSRMAECEEVSPSGDLVGSALDMARHRSRKLRERRATHFAGTRGQLDSGTVAIQARLSFAVTGRDGALP